MSARSRLGVPALAALAGLIMGSLTAGPLVAQDGWIGDWNGTLEAGGGQLRLVLHVEAGGEEASGLTVTMDSPDQGAFGIPATGVSAAGDSLTIVFANIGGRYTGARNATGDTLSGSWAQGGQTFPLVLTRGPEEQAQRPQEPQAPFPYLSEDVSFAASEDRVVLAGTLTVPEGDGPHPAAVLVSGSGPQNRDEEVFGHRPFLVLADYLTRRGVAVLRYDERGVGESSGDFAAATSEDFARDAEAALRYLLTRDEINPAALGIIGHSEGGTVAQLLASRSANVAWIVMLAGPGVPGDSLLVMQGAAINRAAGMPEVQRAKNTELQRRLLAVARSDRGRQSAEAEVLRLLEEGFPEITAEQARAEVANVTSPWLRWFVRYDPAPVLRRITLPVLALNGSKDLQVPAAANLAGIEAGLAAAGNEDVTITELPDLNHLLQTADTGLVSEYGQIEETIAPVALETIGDWILARVRPGH